MHRRSRDEPTSGLLRACTVKQDDLIGKEKSACQRSRPCDRKLLHFREEHSMDQCRSRLKLSENFERHWSILISGEIHMDQSLVHTFSWGNSYGPMVLKVFLKFPPTLVLVHGWLFPAFIGNGRNTVSRVLFRRRELTEPQSFGQTP